MPLRLLYKFYRNSRGNIAVVTGLTLLPMLGAIGLAVDYNEIARHRGVLQQALDASALATATQLGKMSSRKELKRFARDFFQANIQSIDAKRIKFVFDKGNSVSGYSIRLNAKFRYKMKFGSLFGSKQALISATSLVKSGNDSLEIVLVLDNSGSMRSSNRIGTAKKAALALVSQIGAATSGSKSSGLVKFALVPFGGQVNIGRNNARQKWMDTTGLSPIHHENLNWKQNPRAIALKDGRFKDRRGRWLTRFSLFDDLNGVRWAGCVEARPWPYHTNDTPASMAKPATLFVPSFAPDEPDDYSGQREVSSSGGQARIFCAWRYWWQRCRQWNDGYRGNYHRSGAQPNLSWRNYSRYKRRLNRAGVPYGGYDGYSKKNSNRYGARIREERYQNSYLKDDKNMPSGIVARSRENTGTGKDQNKRQNWTWKYLNQRPKTGSFTGPNHGCTTRPLTPLTSNSGRIKAAINAMQANGLTNIPLGIAWGWRVLSKAPPFTQGRPASAKNNQKIMIVMTDGNNYYGLQRTFNESYYGAHGLQKNKRLFDHFEGVKNPRASDSNFQKALDEHMLETCGNARRAGIKIYTVAFDVRNSSSVKKTLQACASKSGKTGAPLYFDASGSAQLLAAFNRIGSEVSQLRIAE